MINENGELAGVLWGSARGTTSGSHIGRVRWFVDPVLASLDGKALPQLASTPPAYFPPENNSSAAHTLPALPSGVATKGNNVRLRGTNQQLAIRKKPVQVKPLPDLLDLLDSSVAPKTQAAPTLAPVPPADSSVASHQPSKPSTSSPSLLDALVAASAQPKAPHSGESRRPRSEVRRSTLPPAAIQGEAIQLVTLDDLAGRTTWDKIKSALALFGGLVVVDQLLRLGHKKSSRS